MLYRRGTVRGRPEDYLIRSTTPMPRFLDDGLYFEHLKRWLDYFPRRQIKVFLYEDVRERPAWVMEEVCAHIRAPFHFARSEEHTSELQSLMRISSAVFCLKNKK